MLIYCIDCGSKSLDLRLPALIASARSQSTFSHVRHYQHLAPFIGVVFTSTLSSTYNVYAPNADIEG